MKKQPDESDRKRNGTFDRDPVAGTERVEPEVEESKSGEAERSKGSEEPHIPQALRLVQLAEERYRFGRTCDGQPFAVERAGPNIALSLGGSALALRQTLAREYRKKFGGVPSSSALTDAMTVLAGAALESSEPERVELRVAAHEGGIIIDLGDSSGRAVAVRANGRSVLERSPVLFRRTNFTGAMPVPEGEGTVDDLWSLLNVTQEDRSLVLGWALAAFMPEMPHPILLLGGEYGSGKSVGTRIIVSIVDPSPAPLRSPPRDEEGWVIPVCAAWVNAFDNVSSIPLWWSDALCRGATGEGWAKRKLYHDSDVTVLAFKRPIILTSIDAGSLKGDLGSRMLLVDLDRIPPEKRLSERQLDARLKALRPHIFGALLDLLVRVLERLPHAPSEGLPRMADFAQLLWAMDAALGTDALSRYAAQDGKVAAEVLESDTFGQAVHVFAQEVGDWRGTAGDLLKRIEPKDGRAPADWPRTPRAASGRLRRLAPTLRTVGVEVTPPAKTDKTRHYHLRAVRQGEEATARTAQPPENGSYDTGNGDPTRAVVDTQPSDRPSNRPTENGVGDPLGADSGDPGDSDDPFPTPSGDPIGR
jgi:hypothetical protein